MGIDNQEIQAQLEVLTLINETKFSYHLYVFSDEWVELWAQRIIFESSLVKEELQRAEKEALTKRLNDGLLKRKEGANLAM